MTLHLRNLAPRPTTVNPDARTVEAIASTGADVMRGGIVERLDLRGADLSRLVGGPVLDGHRAASTRDQLGVVIAAELRPEGLWVRLQFRDNEAARAVLKDIADGTLRGLSIGYSVAEWKDSHEGGRRIRTATKLTLIEVSIVPVPADPGAYFRNGDTEMPNSETIPETMTRAQANTEIRSIAGTAGLTREWADAQIDAEATPDAARAAAFEAMRARSAQAETRTTRAAITADHTAPEVIASRAGEALFARAHQDHQVSDAARQYQGMTTLDLARDCLRRNGAPTTGLAPDSIITRALHTTADFPLILGDAVGRELRRAYGAAPSGIRKLARQGTIRDFRAKRSLLLGKMSDLEQVPEAGEFTQGTIGEAGEQYGLATYGKIFAISRQALINDDLSAFTAVPARLGAAASLFEARTLAGMVNDNPAMADGETVFDATHHGNQKSATATGAETTALEAFTADLAAARLGMRKQTGIGGEPINVTPRFVLVPPELETVAQQALSAVQATATRDANPFSGLELIVDAHLASASRWYLVADPAHTDGLEFSYLEGAPGPQIETKAGFEVDGVQIKVRLDFGAGWLDWRGWYRVGA